MASGGMDQTSIISLLAFGLSFATFIVIRLNRRDEAGDEIAYGDIVELPAAARNAGGGRQIRSDGLAQRTLDRTHVGTGL